MQDVNAKDQNEYACKGSAELKQCVCPYEHRDAQAKVWGPQGSPALDTQGV